MGISLHSEAQFWQIVDGPRRLVLWKSKKKSSFVQCAMVWSFTFNLCFLTVHVNMLQMLFLMQSDFLVLGYRDQSAGS